MSEHIKVELDFIPVEERLPDEGLNVAVINGWMLMTAYQEDEVWWDVTGPCVLEAVTHWAEIPEIKAR